MNLAERETLAACAEYESSILDSVVDGLDAKTLAHLQTCRRCALAAKEYDEIADLTRTALVLAPKSRPWFASPAATLAAALVLLCAALVLHSDSRDATALADTHGMTVLPGTGAVVDQIDSLHARIREGESTFVFADSRPSVETPFGSMRCSGGCEFTVQIERDVCGLALPPFVDSRAAITSLLPPVKMTIHVASGEVAANSNGRSDILTAAHCLTLPFDHYR